MPWSQFWSRFGHNNPRLKSGIILSIVFKRKNGGAKGSRTPDLLNAIQALYQLSYGPIWFGNLVQTDRVVGSTEPTRGPRIDVSVEGIKTGVAATLQQAISAVALI